MYWKTKITFQRCLYRYSAEGVLSTLDLQKDHFVVGCQYGPHLVTMYVQNYGTQHTSLAKFATHMSWVLECQKNLEPIGWSLISTEAAETLGAAHEWWGNYEVLHVMYGQGEILNAACCSSFP